MNRVFNYASKRVQYLLTLALFTLTFVNAQAQCPTADAGGDQTMCESDAIILLHGTASNYVNIDWQTLGSGSFDDDSSLDPLYTPSATDIANGSVTILFHAIKNNGHCPSGTDAVSSMVLTINEIPTVDAGIDQTVCSDENVSLNSSVTNYNSVLWSSSGDGSFSDNSSITPVYYPGPIDIVNGNVQLSISVIANSPCSNISDILNVIINPVATADAGADGIVCADDTYSLSTATSTNNSSVIWSTSGSGSFSNTTTLNPIYTPSSADAVNGSVVLSLQANNQAPCIGSINDNLTLIIESNPTASAGDNIIMCENESSYSLTSATASNYSSLLWSTSGTGTFSNNSVLNPIYSPGISDFSSGTVTLTLDANPNAPCGIIDNSSMTMTFASEPVVDAGLDKIICSSENLIITDASASIYNSLLWSSSGDGSFTDAAALSTTYIPGTGDINTGSVNLRLTATASGSCTGTVSDIKILTIRANPSVSAGSDETICDNQSLSVSTAMASDYLAISWVSSGTGSFTNSTTLNPIYTPSSGDLATGNVVLTVTATAQSPCSNPVADNMTLTITTSPTASAGNDDTYCTSEPNYSLNGSATNYGSINWTSSGTGTIANPGTLSANYTPSASDITNGTVTLTMTVTGDGSCPLENASDAMILTIVEQASVNAGVDGLVCNGSDYSLSAIVTNYTTLLWTTSGNGSFINETTLTPTYTPGSSDIVSGSVSLTLTASSVSPCTNDVSDIIVISIIDDPIVSAGADQESCGTTGVNLIEPTSSNYSTVLWTSNGSGSFNDATTLNPIYTPSAGDVTNGSVILSIEANPISPCNGSVNDNLNLSLTVSPTAYAGADVSICAGNDYTIMDATTTNSSSISWSTAGDGVIANGDSDSPTYTPGTNDIISGSVNLTMTVSGEIPCAGDITDDIVFTIDAEPTANAGSNSDICESDSYTTSGIATNESSYLWSSNGTGIFANASSLITSYTPSASDITNGSVSLTLTVNGNGACTIPATSTIIITIIDEPIANAGPNVTICEGAYFVSGASVTDAATITWTTTGDGNFADNTVENPVYTPGATDVSGGTVVLTISVTPNAPCASNDADDVVLTVVEAATVFAGANASICETSTSYLLSGAIGNGATSYVWTSTGSGTFIDNTIVNATYNPSAADIANGGVTLALSGINPPCNTEVSAMFLTIYEEPTVDAGTNTSVCDNTSFANTTATAADYSSILWTSSGTGSFDDASLENPTYNPTAADYAAGIVTLTITANAISPCGGSVSDFLLLTFEDEPIADAGNGGTICETDTFTITDASASDFDNVSWNGGDGTWTGQSTLVPTYTPGPNDIVWGTVTLTLTANPNSPCNAAAIDNTTLIIQSLPTVDAGDDESICEGESISVATSSASDYAILLWTTTGTGTFDDGTIATPIYTPSAADISSGTVTIQLTATSVSPCGGTNDDSMVLTILQDPEANAGSDATICEDGSYFIFDASAVNHSTTVWTTSGDGSFSNAAIIDPVYTPGSTDIINGTTTLTLTTTGNSPCLGSDNDQMIITIDPLPTVEAGTNSSICEGDYFTTTTASVSDHSSILWTTDGTGAFTNNSQIVTSYTPSTQDINTGTITLTLSAKPTGSCTNTVSDIVIVTIIAPPTVDAGPDLDVCESGITITTATADEFSTILWTTSGSSGTITNSNTLYPTYTPSPSDVAAGSVTLTVTVDPNAPCTVTATDDVVITIGSDPDVDAGVDATICETDSYTIGSAVVTNYTSLLWSTSGDGVFLNSGTLTPTYTPGPIDITNGNVTLTLTADAILPCVSTPSNDMILTIQNLATVEAGSSITICNGESHTTSDATAIDYVSLLWTSSGTGSFDDNSLLNSIYTPSASDVANGFVVLTLSAENTNPCSGSETDDLTILFQDEPTADAGSDGQICETDDFTVTDANATVYSSILWTTSGNGTFTNETSLSPTYVPGSADAAAGTVTLTMTVQSVSPCTVIVSDDIILIVDPMPTMNAGNDESVCEGETITLTTPSASDYTSFVWTTSGSGVFTNGNTLTPTYTPDAADIALGSVILRLTGEAVSPCTGSDYDEMTLTVVSLPEANAGIDEVICDNESLNITTATASDYSSLLWTTSGTGVFSDAAALNPIYNPSVDDITAGTVNLTLTSISNTPCIIDISDEMILTIDLGPIAFAGDDADVCEGSTYIVSDAIANNYNSVAWTTLGTGTLSDANTLTPSYTPSAADVSAGTVELILTVSGSVNCSDSVDTVILNLFLDPVVDAGSDVVSCEDGNYNIVGVSVTDYNTLLWTTSGTGIFSNENILLPDYIPSAADLAAGSVVLTLSATANSPCSNSDADSFTLSFQDIPTAIAGSDETICEGDDITITSASATNYASINWTTSGTGSFVGSNTLAPVYSPSAGDVANGNVILTINIVGVAPCGDTSDDMIVTIQALPILSAGSDAEICEDQSYTISTATASNYNTLNWTTSGDGIIINGIGLTPTYTPGINDLINGQVTLTVEASSIAPCLGSTASSMILSFSEQVDVVAGVDVTLCEGESYVNVDATVANESTVIWTSNGTGVFTDATLLNTSYLPSTSDFINGTVILTLTATADSPCLGTNIDDLVLTLIPNPIVEAGDDADICEGNSFSISTASATLYDNIFWSTSGSGTFTGGSTITPTYTPSSDDIIDGSVTLTLTAEGDIPCSILMADAFTLTIISEPTIDAGSNTDICTGQSYTVMDASASDYSSLTWTSTGSETIINPNSLNPNYTPSAADYVSGSVELTLSAVSNNPCSAIITDVMTINLFNSPSIDAGTDDGICENETYTLINATASDYTSLVWTTDGDGSFDNAGSLNPVYTPGGVDIVSGSVNLILSGTSVSPCTGVIQNNIVLTISPLPIAFAGPDVSVCEGSYILTNATAQNYTSISWGSSGTGLITNGSTLTPTYSPSADDITNGSVTLTLIITGSGNCSSTDSDEIVLNLNEIPTVFAGNDGTICEDESFNITSSTASNYSTVHWTTAGDGTFTAITTLLTIYTPGANDILNGNVNLTLTALALAPCSSSESDIVNLNINDLPSIYAGSDESLCGTVFTVTDATASDYNDISWTVSGTGVLADANTLTPTYTPSTDDITNGSVVLTMGVTGVGACTNLVQDAKEITFTESVSINAGSDNSICQGELFTINDANGTNYGSVIWTTTGTGIFADATTLTPIYTPSIDDIANGSVVLTVSATGIAPCGGGDVDDMVLIIEASPAAYAGADTHIDAGTSYTITDAISSNYASVYWESTGNGVFIDDNTLVPTYTPSADDIINGQVTLTLNSVANTPCITNATDVLILTIGNLPTINAGDDSELCEDGLFIVSTSSASDYSAIQWITSGTGLLTNDNTLFPTYEPSTDDITAGSIILTATVTALAPSTTTVSDQMELSFHELAIVNAGADVSICDNENFIIIGSTASGYSSVYWTTAGTGLFSNAFDVNSIYTPSDDDIANGSVVLTLNAISQTPCDTEVSDNVVLSFDPSVFVNAGVDATVCAGGSITITTASSTDYSSLSWTHDGSGTITDNNTINPIYYPSAADEIMGSVTLTLTGIGNAPCTVPETDHMLITIADAPSVSAGDDTSLCVGEDIYLENATANNYSSVAWTSTGTGLFNNNNLLNPTYIPSANDIANGTVTLTITVIGNSICPGVYVDQIVISISELPTADAGDNESVCQGENVSITTATAINYGDLLWTSDGSGTIISGNTIAPIYVPSAADIADGTVILTLTVNAIAPCTSNVTDQMLITIGGGSTAFAGSDASICEGNTHTITDAFALNYTSYSWSHNGAGSLTNTSSFIPTYIPHNDDFITGTVIITLTAEGGVPCPNPINDFMVLSLFNNPTVDAGSNEIICETDNYINTSATATEYSSLLWTSSGSGTFVDFTVLHPIYQASAADQAIGNVVLTLTASPINPCNIDASDQLIITFEEQPIANAGDDGFVCEGNTFSITTASAQNYTSIIWTSSGDGSFINSNTITPTYLPGSADLINGSAVLTLTIAGIAPCSYTVTDNILLDIYQHPNIDAGLDITICESDVYVVSDASVINYSSLLWTSSGTGSLVNATTLTPEYTASATDVTNGSVTLTLTANDNAPCSGFAIDEKIIFFQLEPNVDAGTDDFVCETDTYSIINSTVSDYSTVLWTSSGDGSFSNANLVNPIYTPGATDLLNGNVTLTLMANAVSPCSTNNNDSFLLTIINQPAVNAGSDDQICSAIPYTLSNASASDYSSVLWTTTGTGNFDDATLVNAIYNPSSIDAIVGSVVLTITVDPINPCATNTLDDMTLIVNQSPIVDAGTDIEICEGQSITIIGASAANYNILQWNSSGTGSFDNIAIQNPIYTPSASDIANGGVVLSLSAIGNAPCTNPVIDQMDLTISSNPTVFAGADVTVCDSDAIISDATASDYDALLWTTSGTGTLVDETSIAPTYIPSAIDITAGNVTLTLTATSTSPCVGTISDEVVVSFTVSSTVDAGGNNAICVGDSYMFNAIATDYTSISWISTGTGIFTNGNTLTPIYIPSNDDYTAGSVDITIEVNGVPPCASVNNTMTLSFIELPTLNAGNDGSVCEGDFFTVNTANATNYSALNWTTNGGGSFVNANSIDPIYIPDVTDIANGNVILTLTATGTGSCTNTVDDSILLDIQSNAIVDLGNDTTICNTDSYTSFVATASNYTSLLWTTNGDGIFTSDNTLITTYIPGSIDITNGSVTILLNVDGEAPCGVISDDLLISFGDSPTADAGSDLDVCTSVFTITDASATNFDAILWSVSGTGLLIDETTINPTYTPDANDLLNGSVIFTLTVNGSLPCDNIITDEKTVTVKQLAIVDAGLDISSCATGGVDIIGATEQFADSLLWISSGTGTFSDASLLNTIYYPSTNDGVVGSVILSLSAYSLPCGIAMDDLTLTLDPVSAVDAGTNEIICEGIDYTIINATAADYSSLLWTSSGSGTWIDETTLNAIYTPSNVDIANGFVELTITAASSIPCESIVNSDSFILAINQNPIIYAGVDTTVCISNDYTIADATASNYQSINWTTSGDGVFDDNLIINTSYTPGINDLANGSVILSLLASNAPCADVIDEVTLNVTPQPIVDAGVDATIDIDIDYVLATATAIDADSVLWVSSGSGSFNDPTLVNAIYTPSAFDINLGTATLTLNAYGAANCDPVSDTMLLTIIEGSNDFPLDFLFNQACESTPLQFYIDLNVTDISTIVSYEWDFGDGTTSIEMEPTHSYAASGDYLVTLIATDVTNHQSVISHYVDVNKLPHAFFSYEQPLCSLTEVNFVDESNSPDGHIETWHWDFGDGNDTLINFPDNPNVTHSYEFDLTYDVILTVETSQGCYDNFTYPIIVDPSPIALFNYNDTCQNMSVEFTSVSVANGGGNIVEWFWNFGDPTTGINNTAEGLNSNHTYFIAGDYDVELVVLNENGCSDTITKTITIVEQPEIAFNWLSNCENATVQFEIDQTITNVSEVVSWFWDFGDGSTSFEQEPGHVYPGNGTYYVSLTIENINGCTNTVGNLINISEPPSALFDYATPICHLEEVEFTYIPASPGSPYVVTWNWDYGDGSNATIEFPNDPNLAHLYANPGTYEVVLNVVNVDGCENTYSEFVTVNASPVANFSFDNTCEDAEVMFTDLSQGNTAGSITQFMWDFGDPISGVDNISYLQHPTHIYSLPGTYNVSLSITSINSCTAIKDTTIIINPKPGIDFDYESSCLNDTTFFNSSNFVDEDAIAVWLWQFGDGSTSDEIDPGHVYNASGDYIVILTVTDTAGCNNMEVKTLNIITAPVAAFTYEGQECSNLPIEFIDQSYAGEAIVQWNWDMGDGNIVTVNYPSQPNITYSYANSGTYEVVLSIITENNCEADISNTIEINISPEALAEFEPTCLGTPAQFNGDALLNGGTDIWQWNWNFGDPISGVNNTSELQNPVHIYTVPGTYNAFLVITNLDGCTDTAYLELQVNGIANVDFAYSDPTCLGDTTFFTIDETTIDMDAVDYFEWIFGDGATLVGEDVDYVYPAPGLYDVILTLVDTAGCLVTSSQTVVVNSLPIVQFSAGLACETGATEFTDYSYGTSDEAIIAWSWNFGDPNANPADNVSDLQNPIHTYSEVGTYIAWLTATSEFGCFDSISVDVTVLNKPIAGFSYDTTSCENGYVTFLDESIAEGTPIESYEWMFEDGYISDLQNPFYIFPESGECYDVRLVVFDMNGCSDTLIQTVCVPVGFAADFTHTSTCYGDTTYFNDFLVSPIGDSIIAVEWVFGDPASGFNNVSSTQNPNHYYENAGSYLVTYTATDENYCTTTVYHTVEVWALPEPSFTWNNPQCDTDIYVTDNSNISTAPIQTWIWNWGDGSQDVVINAPMIGDTSHTYVLDGEYEVQLEIIDANGCSNVYTEIIIRRPCVDALFTVNNILNCARNTVTFIDQSVNPAFILDWNWDFGDGNSMNYQDFINFVDHEYDTAGQFTVVLDLTADYNGQIITASYSQDIIISPTPIATILTENVCNGNTAYFYDQSITNGSDIVTWDWDFGDLNSTIDISSQPNDFYYYPDYGSYNVTLSVSNAAGCSDVIDTNYIVYKNPVAAIAIDNRICKDDQIFFIDYSDTTDTNGEIVEWKWDFGIPVINFDTSNVQDPYYIYDTIGDFLATLNIVDSHGCKSYADTLLSVLEVPTADFTFVNDYDEKQGNIQFTNLSEGDIEYLEWDFGFGFPSIEENPIVQLEDDGEFSFRIVVIHTNGCSDTLVQMHDQLFKTLFIPNAFSPNNTVEGVKTFNPVGRNLIEYKMQIFDIRGNILFETSELDDHGRPRYGWDGKFNGIEMQQGVYLWRIFAVFKDGTIWNGSVVGDHEFSTGNTEGSLILIK